MTVISSTRDDKNLTLVLVADFAVTPEQVWELWENPRKLEQWWGPPTYPATFSRHDFFVGGESRYFMTGPEGDTARGWWRIEALEKPHRLEFSNGLAGDDGEPVPGVEPMPSVMTLEARDGGTRMTATSHFLNTEQMEMMLGMGMEEGMTLAMGQIDNVLLAV